jgi:DNA-binding response OmpR family regulator
LAPQGIGEQHSQVMMQTVCNWGVAQRENFSLGGNVMIPIHLRNKRILCVEDHEDTLELITMVLEERQYEVTTARSIQSAWELASRRSFDLFLLDSWLLDGSGLTLCKRIREIDSQTPILFYSAAAYEVDRDTALRAGAQGYLIKPASLTQLCELVSELIYLQSEASSDGR